MPPLQSSTDRLDRSEWRPTLPERMRGLAAEGVPSAAELVAAADKLDAAIKDGSIPQLVGAWARARKIWCAATGDALV